MVQRVGSEATLLPFPPSQRQSASARKATMPSRQTMNRTLAALCIVAALGIASAVALADEPEAVICIDESAAYFQAWRAHSDSEDGSLKHELAARAFDEAHFALVACVARQEGLCGQVGRMLRDLDWESKTELEELWRMHWNCVFTGQPDG